MLVGFIKKVKLFTIQCGKLVRKLQKHKDHSF